MGNKTTEHRVEDMKIRTTVLKKLTPIIETSLKELKDLVGNYDFVEVFKYAVNPESVDGVASRETFVLDEVKKVIASANGNNDGPNWLILGQLRDKRYFFISAGCDYSGWD